MEVFSRLVHRLSKAINVIAGIFLIVMALFSVSHLALRSFWKLAIGSYQTVALSGIVVRVFPLPSILWIKGQAVADFPYPKPILNYAKAHNYLYTYS